MNVLQVMTQPSKSMIDKVGTVPAALAVGYVGYKLLRTVWHGCHFILAHTLPGKDLAKSYKLINDMTTTNTRTKTTQEGSYIVISGTTNKGIGYAFAQEFAAAGFSLVLIGRGQEKLEAIATELKRSTPYCIDVKCLELLDLGNLGGTQESTAVVNQLLETVQELDIAGVVHAAGMETISTQFSNLSMDKNRMAINLNATTPVLLTQALLPKLTDRVHQKLAKRSMVIFVGAGAGLRPSPCLNVYAATKSLINFFSQALSVEFATSLDVLVTHPLGVATAMVDEQPDGLIMITPQQCAHASLRQLGGSWGQQWTNGWFFHEIQWSIMSRLPDVVYHNFFRMIIRKMEAIKNKKK